MTNEEKAEKICCTQGCSGGIEYCIKIYGKPCPTYTNCLEMAEWKDQQMIEKACEWLKDMACYYAHWEFNSDSYENEIVYDTEKLIEDFKKAMEGGEE